MDVSIFLARVIGFYFLIMGLFYLSRRRFIEKKIPEFFEHSSLIVFVGAVDVIIGLLIVVGHNIWVWNWVLTITLLGYLSLLKGTFCLFVPVEYNRKITSKLVQGSSPVFTGIICLIISLFLIYEGFLV